MTFLWNLKSKSNEKFMSFHGKKDVEANVESEKDGKSPAENFFLGAL